jgi:hypothetical protein
MAIRQGDWKYIPANTVKWASGIGEGANPSDKRFAEIHTPEALLFNLADDPGEATNVIRQFPRTAAKLEAQLNKVKNGQGKAAKGNASD